MGKEWMCTEQRQEFSLYGKWLKGWYSDYKLQLASTATTTINPAMPKIFCNAHVQGLCRSSFSYLYFAAHFLSFTDPNVESPTADEANLTNPCLYKRPVLDYQRIDVDRDYVNFIWKNYQEAYPFEVSLYTQNEIDIAESQRDLTPEMTLSEKRIRSTYNQFYFRISVMEIDNLESTSAFYSLSHIIASANSRYYFYMFAIIDLDY